MLIKRLVAICLIAVLLCSTLCACGDSGAPTITRTPAPTPISEDNQKDYTDDPALLESIVAYRQSFSDLTESPAADFAVDACEGGVAVLSYRGSDKRVRVPEMINGSPVVAVTDAAFANNTVMTALYLPDSIGAIGEGILSGCQSLACLRTPLLGASKSGDQYIGYLFGAKQYSDNAMHVPASLKYLELGVAMEELADYALFDAANLVCLTLPETLTRLGSYSMYRCSDLVAVNLSGVRVIEDHAMSACSSLSLIELGGGVTAIGLGAFEGCISIRRMILPFIGATLAEGGYLGYLFGAEAPDFSEGYYPPYLVEVELLTGCTAIGDYAFYECGSLTRLSLPEGIASIGVRALSGCGRLEGIAFPDSLTSIRENAFSGCRNLRTVDFGEDSMLTSIGINAFYGCDALTEVRLPSTLTALPASCFADCRALTTLELGGVLHVGKNAFRHCTALTAATAKKEIKLEKGNDALSRCLSQ